VKPAWIGLLAIAAGAASAQIPSRDGEFRRNPASGEIGCMQAAPTSSPDYGHCLRLGRLQIGAEFYQLQIRLSDDPRVPAEYITRAREVNRTPEGHRAMLIALNAAPLASGQLRLLTYVMATIDDANRVVALQLTGNPGPIAEELPFSGIRLGAPQQRVVDTLGLPSAVKDVPEIKGKQWNYAPFPFSIELVNGVVYSIRVEKLATESLGQTFRPLSRLPQ